MRYGSSPAAAVGWWLHDVIVHPFTGHLGLLARMCGSLRLAALAHHIHNATAPSNDAMADYAQASQRAGSNERFVGDTEAYTKEQQMEFRRQQLGTGMGQRVMALKILMEEGAITKEEYAERRDKILAEYGI